MSFNTEKIIKLCNQIVESITFSTSTKDIKEYINVLRFGRPMISLQDLKLFIDNCPDGYGVLTYTLEQLIMTSKEQEIDLTDEEINFYCKLAKAYDKNNKIFDMPSTAKKF